MPKTLLLKTVEEPLRMAMQAMVTAKKLRVQEEVSTFTSTVITTKMASMTASEASTRMCSGTLQEDARSGQNLPGGPAPAQLVNREAGELGDWDCPHAAGRPGSESCPFQLTSCVASDKWPNCSSFSFWTRGENGPPQGRVQSADSSSGSRQTLGRHCFLSSHREVQDRARGLSRPAPAPATG